MKNDVISDFICYLNAYKKTDVTKSRLEFMHQINRYFIRFAQFQKLNPVEEETLKKYIRKQFFLFVRNNTKQPVDLWNDIQSYLPEIYRNMTLKKAYQNDSPGVFKYLYLLNKKNDISSMVKRCISKATTDNKYNIVKMLISEGADVNASVNGKSLLLTAGCTGNADMVRLYLQNGADASICNGQKGTILHYVCNNFEGARFPVQERIRLIEELVKTYKIDINSKTKPKPDMFFEAETPLLHSVVLGMSVKDKKRKINIQVVKKLVELGANVNYSANGSSPLSKAARTLQDTTDIMDVLLKAGAEPNFKEEPPLLWAINTYSSSKVNLLLDAGAGYFKKSKLAFLAAEPIIDFKFLKIFDFDYNRALEHTNNLLKNTNLSSKELTELKTIKFMIHKKISSCNVKKKETKKEFLQRLFNRQRS